MCTLETLGDIFILTLTGSTDHRLSLSLMTTLESHLTQIRSESKPGSILITTARGSNFFSNGFDLAWAESNGPSHFPTRLRQLGLQFKSLISSLTSLPLPTIAAVTGHAAAAGFMFAVSHDYVLMRRDRGVLYMSEIDLGITFPDYTMRLLKAKLGGKCLRDMVLAGMKVRGGEAVKMGVVDQAYDTAEETVEAALRLGEKLALRKWNGEVYAEIRKSTVKELLPGAWIGREGDCHTQTLKIRDNLGLSSPRGGILVNMCTLETRGDIFILTLTGPTDHRLSPSLMTTLESHLTQIRSESKPGSILITTARGSNFFSNGFDLAWAESNGPSHFPTRLRQLGLQFKSLISSLMSLPLPTIAAVTGHAAAAGFMFAVSHDYVLMRRDRGVLYMSEIDLGMTFADYMMRLLKVKLGGKCLRDMVLAGMKVKGDEAVKMGVVDQVCDTAEDTIEAALRLGEKLALRKWNGEVYAEIRKSTMKELLPGLGLAEKVIVAPRL